MVRAGGNFDPRMRCGAFISGDLAAASGDVRIAWMDARNPVRPDRPLWNTFLRSSTNGGTTWGRKSTVGSSREYDRATTISFQLVSVFRLAISSAGHRQPGPDPRGLGRGPELQGSGVDLVHSRPIAVPGLLFPPFLYTIRGLVFRVLEACVREFSVDGEPSMNFLGVNLWAVLVPALATMVVGFLWYRRCCSRNLG